MVAALFTALLLGKFSRFASSDALLGNFDQAFVTVPIILGLLLHLQARKMGHIGASITANNIASVVADVAVLIPLS